MKKQFMIPAAIAFLMGVGGYLGHAASTPADDLSDLQLANAEALAEDEIDLPGVIIVCDGTQTKGHCWTPNTGIDRDVRPCLASGNRLDYCA